VKKVRDIKLYELGEGGYANKSTWVEIPMPAHKKRKLLRRMNFLNKLPFTLALKFIKKK
jgi:hypothetical protein